MSTPNPTTSTELGDETTRVVIGDYAFRAADALQVRPCRRCSPR